MPEPTVFIVDDHAGVRDSITELVSSVGLRYASFESAQHFLDAFDPDASGCLVLDVRMAHMSGPALQERLIAMGARIPIVFISGHGDIDVAVKTIKAGAIDFVKKPYRDQQLLESINDALSLDRSNRRAPDLKSEFAVRLAKLSDREREVEDRRARGARIVEHRRRHRRGSAGAIAPPPPNAIAPADALKRLMEGNARYAANTTNERDFGVYDLATRKIALV